MNYCDIGSAKIAYEIYGAGGRTIVIDTGLGSVSAEWRHIAEELGAKYKVLLYDRAGYGKSSVSTLERTPRNIAVELNKLLSHMGFEKDIIFAGHSQGGLYAVQYALMFPEKVGGLILLDPATPFDGEFKEKLTDDEYKGSGVDKTKSLKMAKTITALHLGFLLKPLLKKGVPFCYYSFSNTEKKGILEALCSKSTYITALEEYKYTHDSRNTEEVENAVRSSGLGNIPIKLITHSSDFYLKELEYYGRMNKSTAEKIENTWQAIMKKFLSLSSDTEHIRAQNSGHYIHLTDFELLKATIENIEKDYNFS